MRPILEELELRTALTASRPNIVLIVTDDQRWDTMQYMPKTQAIMGQGTTFDNAFVTTPLCCPSRSSILTGLYASNHNVRGNLLTDNFPAYRSVAKLLHDAGYFTGLYGKYLNGYDKLNAPPGWDEWHAFWSHGRAGNPRYYNYKMNNNGRLDEYGDTANHYSTDVVSRNAQRFIREHAEARDAEPFFLYVAPYAPHAPATPAPRHAKVPVVLPPERPGVHDDNSDKPPWVAGKSMTVTDAYKTKYLRSLMAVDEMVEALHVETVAADEIANTVFIFTSDNGIMWGEHGLYGKPYPYEEAIRVPMFVLEGWNPVNDSRGEMVLNIDITPTILDYAGLSSATDGQSMRDLSNWREYFTVESWATSLGRQPFTAQRFEHYIHVRHANGMEEFYDLVNDPYQLDQVFPIPA